MTTEGFSKELQEAIFGALPVFVIILGAEGNVIYHNRTAENVFKKSVLGMGYLQLFSVDNRTEEESTVCVSYESWVGNRCYFVTDFYTTTSVEGCCRVLIGEDVTNAKSYLLNFSNNAMIDQMTGCFNRQSGIDVLNEMICDIENEGGVFSVVFLDLDNLKAVNDNHGHIRGDDYIVSVCETIKACIRKSDIVARMGGDEFLIILPKCSESVTENIMKNVERRLEEINKNAASSEVVYRISYGMVEINEGNVQGSTFESILNAADSKMYFMKNNNKQEVRRGDR